MIKVYPVIHHRDARTTLRQAEIVASVGGDGVFLISHDGNDHVLSDLGATVKSRHPELRVGLNFLSLGVLQAADAARAAQLDMVWGDDCGLHSEGVDRTIATPLTQFADKHRSIQVFGSVAFKGQPQDNKPAKAARLAQACGFTPTTSGSRTGSPPDIEKIERMSRAVRGKLAIASGMTIHNVAEFVPYVSDILVSTGIAKNEYEFDPDMVALLTHRARATYYDGKKARPPSVAFTERVAPVR